MMSRISRTPARSVFHSRSVDMKFCRMRIGARGIGGGEQQLAAAFRMQHDDAAAEAVLDRAA